MQVSKQTPTVLELQVKSGTYGWIKAFLLAMLFILGITIFLPTMLDMLALKLSLPKYVILDKRKNRFCVGYENALSQSSRVEGRLSDIEKARRYTAVQLVLKSGSPLNIAVAQSRSDSSPAHLVDKINQFLHEASF